VDPLVRTFRGKKSEWDMRALKAEQGREQKELLESPGYVITTLLRSVIPDHIMTVWDLNLISYWAEYYFPVLTEGTFITPRGTSPIFYAVPAAIGAKIARPEVPCLCVTGDGSVLPTLSEFATAKKYDIPVVFLVYNNNSYGILDEYMVKRYGLPGSMSLTNPDFVKLAQSFGIKAVRAKTPDELRRALRKETNWTEPFLIEFDYPVFAPPWQI
jgi:acetolactate synthase I/II/III large subunit